MGKIIKAGVDKMNLLFDLRKVQPLPNNKFHGGGVYGEAVFFAMLKRTKNFIGIYDSKLYINPKILESGIKLCDVNQISPEELIKKENVDSIFIPVHFGEDKWHEMQFKRYIYVWHDVRWLEMLPPGNMVRYYEGNLKIKTTIRTIIKSILPFIRKYLEKKRFEMSKAHYNQFASLKNAEFITVSEHSKYGIIGFYPHLAKKNIPVLYSPLDDEQIEQPQSKFEPKSYFLLTSSSRIEKNNLRAVWAFDEILSERKDLSFKVILTGVTDEKIFTRNLKNRDKFILLDYIDRAELLSLHKNAYAFIYPSLSEGFGYPPIQSMKYGVPVAASGTSSIPEICQNAAIYFDPYNVSEIKNRILQLLNEDIHAEYSARAIERYKVVSERQRQDLEKLVDFILGNKK